MSRYILVTLAVLVLFVSPVFAAGKVLLIGSGAPDAKDVLVIEHLEEWGYEVDPHGHLENAPGKPIVGDYDFVFISESTSSGNILDAYKDSTIPVVNAETWVYDDMGFALDGTFSDVVGTTLQIENHDHPITEGFPDTVEVYSASIILMTCNGLDGDVEVLAVRDDLDDFVGISVYEEGAKTLKGSTKARHVNIFPHSTAWGVVTDDGWELIRRSVLYAVGELSLSVEADGKLATTWSSIKSNRYQP